MCIYREQAVAIGVYSQMHTCSPEYMKCMQVLSYNMHVLSFHVSILLLGSYMYRYFLSEDITYQAHKELKI